MTPSDSKMLSNVMPVPCMLPNSAQTQQGSAGIVTQPAVKPVYSLGNLEHQPRRAGHSLTLSSAHEGLCLFPGSNHPFPRGTCSSQMTWLRVGHVQRPTGSAYRQQGQGRGDERGERAHRLGSGCIAEAGLQGRVKAGAHRTEAGSNQALCMLQPHTPAVNPAEWKLVAGNPLTM